MLKNKWLLATIIIVVCIAIFIYTKPEKPHAQDQAATTPKGHKSNQLSQASLVQSKQLQTAEQAITSLPVNSTKADNVEIGFWDCLPNITLDTEQYQADIEQHFQSLASSNNLQDKLYHALYAKFADEVDKAPLFFDYFQHGGNHPLAAMALINSCTFSESKLCTDKLVWQMTNVDSDNGAIYLYAVSYFAKNGNSEQVLAAVELMTQTPFFNEYFGKGIKLYIDALSGSTTDNFAFNFIAAMGQSAASIPPYQPISKWCGKGEIDHEVANACIVLGQQLNTRAQTFINQVIGMKYQEQGYKVLNDSAGLELVEQARLKSNDERALESSDTASFMMMLDERLARIWLAHVDVVGELEAQRAINKEAEILYTENENFVCELIYDAVSALQ